MLLVILVVQWLPCGAQPCSEAPFLSYQQTNEKFNRLKLRLFALSQDRVAEIIGYPSRFFRYNNKDIWYYSRIYQVAPLENVYITFKRGKVEKIQLLPSSVNPYLEFEVN
jgi:hypothetical protein